MRVLSHHQRHAVLALLVAFLSFIATSVYAAGPPVANVSKSSNLTGTLSNPSGKVVPWTAHLDGSLSTCPNGCTKPDSFVWDFGDNAPPLQVKTWDREYNVDGVYIATFTVTDDTGLKSTAKVTVTVNLPAAESLTTYVQECQKQLNFQNIPIPDNISCYSGDLFATPNDFNKTAAVRDFLGYRKITDQVDMAFACRWLAGDPTNSFVPISIEMLVHNRSSGNTCFFSAKGFISGHQTALNTPVIRSPTSSAATAFWDSPSAVNIYARCVGCHVEGPYIATPTIAPFLSKYGLLNNGHDTGSSITYNSTTHKLDTSRIKYHAIVTPNTTSAFAGWDTLKQSYMDPSESSCSLGCHVIGTLSPQQEIGQNRPGFEAILTDPSTELYEIDHAGVMAPYDNLSNYRWINLAIPDAGTENETFANAQNANTTLVPELLSSCVDPSDTSKPGVPGQIEIHAVGSDNLFVVSQPSQITYLPDRLSRFNLKEGLTCLNSDQDPGRTCANYTLQYECTNNTTFLKNWVNWTAHPLSSDGDHEERNGANPCPSGSTATGIKATAVASNGWISISNGPNDRLAYFSQYGLTCNNSDQPDGKCSNYVVRYSSCTTPPKTQANKTLTNENVPASGAKQLTAAANSLTKGQGHNGSWNTQVWSIEPITNTEYVRLHNVPNNLYLTVTSTAEQATVGTATFNTSSSEMWLIEPVANSSYVRLKNLFSGKYLTMGDPNSFPSTPDYIPIYSQGRNTGWNTQRWLIQ